ncbi:MAG: iron uptake porin [Cyanothece sp. SIO1E1]|nr:iron uptake porin [Cyanothece sp. SIO1E1]
MKVKNASSTTGWNILRLAPAAFGFLLLNAFGAAAAVEAVDDTAIAPSQTVSVEISDASISLADLPEAQSAGSISIASNQIASEPAAMTQVIRYTRENKGATAAQVTSVSQLSDVQPTDWAFQALQSLVERYGCIAGFPDGTYRGNRATTRFEFAAGLNACLDRVLEIVGSIDADDLETIKRLQEEFAAELATLRGRVDSLEARTAELEANQFSTTTRLSGEVIFAVSDAFGTGDIDENQTVFQDRVRLNLLTSFTGKDVLLTQIEAGNATPFGDSSILDQGTTTFNFLDTGNDFVLDALAYTFPAGPAIVYIAAAAPFWQDFVPVMSPALDDITGGSAALTAFGESSPLYKIGLAVDTGLGFSLTPDFGPSILEKFTFSGGYFADTSSDPAPGSGFFNGAYAALGQLTFQPADKFGIAFTYSNSYFNDLGEGGAIFDFGVGTITTDDPVGNDEVIVNAYGIEAFFEVSDRFIVNAFGLFADAQEAGGPSDAEIWSYALGLAFPDLLSEGSLGGIIAGVEPYVGGDDDVALRFEGFYKYQLNDFISVTPGIIFVAAPSGDFDEDGFIGILRTTFLF